MTVGVSERRVEARRILGDIARQIDRKLTVDVRDIPGNEERVQVTLAQGQKSHQVELRLDEIMNAADDSALWHALKLRIKRTADAMTFRKIPDHRSTVKATPIPPQAPAGGRGKGSFSGRKP